MLCTIIHFHLKLLKKLHFYLGEIHVTSGLDREQKSFYELVVIATDGVHHTVVNVTICINDTNDNTPQFDQPAWHFDVVENSPPGVIGKVTAKDEDSGENGEIIFFINQTGIVTV